jgi:molybdopterin synthase sulfur carrier subunit
MTVPSGAGPVTIRVELPAHLRELARVTGEVALPVTLGGEAGTLTLAAVLDALESAYPVLRGTMRDQQTGRRRPFVRFYACRQDLSNDAPDQPLPEAVRAGTEPLLVIGAMAGG